MIHWSLLNAFKLLHLIENLKLDKGQVKLKIIVFSFHPKIVCWKIKIKNSSSWYILFNNLQNFKTFKKFKNIDCVLCLVTRRGSELLSLTLMVWRGGWFSLHFLRAAIFHLNIFFIFPTWWNATNAITIQDLKNTKKGMEIVTTMFQF